LATPAGHGVACQVRSLRGEVLLQTRGDLAGVFGPARPGFSERTRNGEQWRVYTRVQNGLSITVADRLQERQQLQLGIVLTAVLPFVVALIGSLVIGWWSIRRGLAPLEQLRDELAERDPDALTPVRVPRAPVELVPVLDTLNALLVQTDQALQREQRFTSNAAHELRTPLTAIKTHVQLARRVDEPGAQRALAGAEAGIARLQRTLEQLLLLARVESGRPWPDDAATEAEDIVRLAMADLNLPDSFSATGKLDDTRVAVPEELAVAALRNLLDNAIKHSGATKSVRLRVDTSSHQVVFEVTDAGAGTETPTPGRFERGRTSGGSGLGLAIVTAIAARFGGTFDIRRQEPHGFCARLAFPLVGHDDAVHG
jgi:signal transduction histidine kinase